MPALPASVESLFVRAGWQPSARGAGQLDPLDQGALVQQVIAQYGGLRVGKTGPGKDLAASDVRFYLATDPEVDQLVLAWQKSLGALVAFASAHHEHMFIFAGEGGRIFAFTAPDGKLYQVGVSFSEAMERLLLGLSYGNPIPSDA